MLGLPKYIKLLGQKPRDSANYASTSMASASLASVASTRVLVIAVARQRGRVLGLLCTVRGGGIRSGEGVRGTRYLVVELGMGKVYGVRCV